MPYEASRYTLLPDRDSNQVSAGGAVSPLHYDAAGSFLAQVALTLLVTLT